MINIKKMMNVRMQGSNWIFAVKGKLQNLIEDFDDETFYAYIDGTYYSIPLKHRVLVEKLSGTFVEAEILMNRIGYMEVKKLSQVSNQGL
ncbi:hypothetical protein [Ilyobacter polytropus]|uniref:Uncharacterized protein n=1 Tax=Ilyobacter polytropus (strain ATCC 51220 / DSM 2926 / LMG 16218 / CuHBu1) TaxID=572544 RepID=E3H9N5_ILYPC|nr:hypothetical protein [Ilyobacter polytropus]ADO83424.1 hypothetical protein Ilyop_1651 [Ilyobacter polytropus DSM 2926]